MEGIERMPKEQIHWEPDIKKGMEIAKNIKDLKHQLKDDADRRKIGGFNPSDLFENPGGPLSKK